MKNPPWIACESSTIASYRWVEGATYPLQIRFKSRSTDPRVTSPYGYVYEKEIYDGLVDAPSKGQYVDAVIKKGGGSYTKLSGAAAA